MQDFLKALTNPFFAIIPRLFVCSLIFIQTRRKQCRAVQFTVYILGQAVQPLKETWNHIIRKCLFQIGAHPLSRNFFPRYIVCAEVILPIVILKSFHNSIFHFRYRGNAQFDLPGFHTLAVDFYHPVLAVHIYVIAVRKLTPHIPGM